MKNRYLNWKMEKHLMKFENNTWKGAKDYPTVTFAFLWWNASSWQIYMTLGALLTGVFIIWAIHAKTVTE